MNSVNKKKLIGRLNIYRSVLILLVICVFATILSPSFLSVANLFNVFKQITVAGIVGCGMTFVILTGGIDLSVGSTLALSSAIMASLIKGGMDPIMGIVVAAIIGLILGTINGVVISYGKVAPFIATLATMTIFRGLTLVYTDGNPISSLTDNQLFHMFGQGYFAGIPVPAVVMLLMFALCWFILNKTPLGRKTYAVGGNEKVSFIAGIKIERIKIFAYAITGLFCALAGAILTSRLNSAQPTAGTGYELDAIAAVVLGGTSLSGGKGRIVGTLIGVLIIGTLNNGLNILNVSSFYQQVVKGIVILLAVLMDRKKS